MLTKPPIGTQADSGLPSGKRPVWAPFLNEGGGLTLYDSITNSTGFFTRASGFSFPTWTAGKYGVAVAFGSPTYAEFPFKKAYTFTNALTLACWVYSYSSPANNKDFIVKIDSPSFSNGYALAMNGTTLRGVINISGTGYVQLTSSGAIPVNTWVHVALTWDGATMRLYVNGNEVVNQAQTGPLNIDSVTPLRLGGDSIFDFFDGIIDLPMMFDSALSPSDMKILGSDAFLTGYYDDPCDADEDFLFAPQQTLNPTTIAGNKVWADASQSSYTDSGKTTAATSSGDLVYVAPDYSGNGNDLTQATSGSRLTYRPAVQNGLAVWRCDTATKFFSVPTGISYNNPTIFVVVKPTTVDASKYRIIFDMYQKLALSSTIPSKSGNWGITLDTDADSAQLLTAEQFYVLSARLRAVGSPSAVDLSTGEQGPWPTFTASGVGYSGGTTHTLGTAGSNGDTFDIGELLVYDNALSDTDFQRVIGYLNEKWGLLVPPAGGSTNATVTAAAIPLTGSLPAPAISAGVTLSPASLTITGAEPAPVESGNAIAAGANQLITFSEPAPAVSGNAGNSPATLVETVSEPAPVVSGNANFSPAALPLTGTVGAVSISTSGSVSVPVSAITFSNSLPADTISAGAGISQATLLITATAPAPVASAGATPAAGTVIATAAFQAVSAAAGAGISPAGLVMGAAAPGTTERGDVNVMASTLTVGMHGPVGSPPAQGGAATAVIGANTAIFGNSGE